MIEIKPLPAGEYKGRRFVFAYATPGCWQPTVDGKCFRFDYVPFAQPQHRQFEDELLGDWLEAPKLLGAFVDGTLAGFIEGSIEGWNDRFRISNLLVLAGFRKQHIGTRLMEAMLREAQAQKARMAVLETQSCNAPAIRFYEKCGFRMIGFDLYAYTNHDMENREVRLEMGRMLETE